MDGVLILAIETATSCGSVSLSSGEQNSFRLLAECIAQPNITHSRRLMGSVQWVMEAAGIGWKDLDGIGVSIGPGSFTGLRIGLAAAKAMAMATGKPLIGVSTLQALALACTARNENRLIGVLLDARKKEVYAGFFKHDAKKGMVQEGSPVVIPPAELLHQLQEPVTLIGPGVAAYLDIFAGYDHIDIFPDYLAAPRAAFVGMLAAQDLAQANVADPATLAPLYVRASEAELNLLRKKA